MTFLERDEYTQQLPVSNDLNTLIEQQFGAALEDPLYDVIQDKDEPIPQLQEVKNRPLKPPLSKKRTYIYIYLGYNFKKEGKRKAILEKFDL